MDDALKRVAHALGGVFREEVLKKPERCRKRVIGLLRAHLSEITSGDCIVYMDDAEEFIREWCGGCGECDLGRR